MKETPETLPALQTMEERISTDLQLVYKDAELTQADPRAQLAQIKSEALQLKTNGIEDKDAYALVVDARKSIKKMRIAAVKRGDSLKREAIDYQKGINSALKEIVSELEDAEAHLQSEQDLVDNEKERLRAEEEKKEAARIGARIDRLMALGCSYNGDSYVYGHLAYSIELIKIAPDAEIEQFILRVQDMKQEEANALKAEQELKAKREKAYQEMVMTLIAAGFVKYHKHDRVEYVKNYKLMEEQYKLEDDYLRFMADQGTDEEFRSRLTEMNTFEQKEAELKKAEEDKAADLKKQQEAEAKRLADQKAEQDKKAVDLAAREQELKHQEYKRQEKADEAIHAEARRRMHVLEQIGLVGKGDTIVHIDGNITSTWDMKALLFDQTFEEFTETALNAGEIVDSYIKNRATVITFLTKEGLHYNAETMLFTRGNAQVTLKHAMSIYSSEAWQELVNNIREVIAREPIIALEQDIALIMDFVDDMENIIARTEEYSFSNQTVTKMKDSMVTRLQEVVDWIKQESETLKNQ